MPLLLADRITVATGELEDQLDDILARVGATAEVSLYQNNPFLSPLLTLAELDVADYTGYAGPLAIGSWSDPVQQTDGSWTVEGGAVLDFGQNTGGADQTVYGYYITDSGGTILHAVARFDTPFVVPYQYNDRPIVLPSFRVSSPGS